MGENNKVRTRFAPSPTGSLHVGGLRTAVYAYALGKHENGDFILRIEDTDKAREVKDAKEKIVEILKTFGLTWEEYYVQSERVASEIYKKAALKLVTDGHAFYCQCKPKNAKSEGFSKEVRDPCRDMGLTSGAIKLKVPRGEEISYTDYILEKEITWSTDDVYDTTLLKSDGFPTYHLGVVVDDYDMRITHVLRGHDWLPSTPVHLLVYKYLGYDRPEIGHLTDILDPDGGKLSKRKGATSCEALLSEGYLPEAILNFVILLGWAPKDNREMFTLSEFVKVFDRSGFQKSNPVFNRDKLDWFNGEYIRKLDTDRLETLIFDFYDKKYPKDLITKVTPLIKDRITKLSEFESLAGFLASQPDVDKALLGKNYKIHLEEAMKTLSQIEDWKLENINNALMKLIKSSNFKTGDFFMDLRIAVTGSKVTPPINESIVILGKHEALARIEQVVWT